MRKLSPTRKALYIISGIAILLLIVLIAVACKPIQIKSYNTAEGECLIACGRFEIGGYTYRVLYDPDTKIEYLVSPTGGITPLYDTWGRFKYYEIPNE